MYSMDGVEVFIFCFLLIGAASSAVPQTPKDLVERMIAEAGFKSEKYEVQTVDGYILTVHRILKKAGTKRLGPVFLMHPLLCTSAEYIRTGPEIALAYLLSENGYDCWLGNSRGNDFGKRHVSLSTDSKEFWNFSWHEIGYIDVPTMFEFMLKKTESARGYYVGYSQGGTSFFIMNSLRPEFNKKIIQSHLMAPAAFVYHALGFLPHQPSAFLLQGILASAEALLSITGYGLQISNSSDAISEVLCATVFGVDLSELYCRHVMSLLCGGNLLGPESDSRFLTKGIEKLTHSVSTKQFLHYLQGYVSEKFAMYDYGEDKNMEIYNRTKPPEYPLENIKTPVFIYAGLRDIVVSEGDLDHLTGILPNVKKYKKIFNYNHCDFALAANSREIVFNEILEAMNAEDPSDILSQTARVKWTFDQILLGLGVKWG